MKYTFLGHQSWLIEEGDTKLLLDPLLFDTFGMHESFGIEVVPPRQIDPEYLQDISGIVISHEHSDHFHLPSLNLLPRTVPVFLGVLTLSPVVSALEELGFTVVKLRSTDEIELGSLSIRFYQAHPKTVIWESRVYQILVRSLAVDYSIFIAVDALISRDFELDIAKGHVDRPNTIMISNNSQIPPKGVMAALDNASVAHDENRSRVGPIALRLVKTIIVDYSDMVDDLRHIVLCGGGFMKSADTFGKFVMSNQTQIADLAGPLFPEKRIVGAIPGMTITNDDCDIGSADWIKLNLARDQELEEKYQKHLENPTWELKSLVDVGGKQEFKFENDCEVVLDCFKEKHRHLLSTDFGRILLSYGDPENIFEIELISNDFSEIRNFQFSPLSGCITRKALGEATSLFGFRAFAADLAAVVNGEIQIWDIAGLSVITWYDSSLGRSIEYSPMAFLYAALGEHFQVDICEKVFMNIAESINLQNKTGTSHVAGD